MQHTRKKAETFFNVSIFIPLINSFSHVLCDCMCLLPYKTVNQCRPTGDQLKSIKVSANETLAETYAVDLQCSSDETVAELHLWYWQLAAADNQPTQLAGDELPS